MKVLNVSISRRPLRSALVTGVVMLFGAGVFVSSSGLALDVVYVVRHAQKSKDDFWRDHGSLRPLSEKGAVCAGRLATKLVDESVAAVYSSETTRTVSTGLAVSGALPATATATDDTVRDLASFTHAARERHADDRAILVVGHSNTVGKVVAAFAPEVEACWDALAMRPDGSVSEAQYGDLWRIEIGKPACEGGVEHATLGQADGVDCTTQ